jgi:phosphoglycerate dehydrogenase-like enzyme
MPAPDSILLACKAELRDDFMPPPLQAELAGLTANFRWLDPSTLPRDEWPARLAAINPEVLVTCWGTPILPEHVPPALRYVCHLAGGVKGIVSRGHLERGLRLTNWGGSLSRTVAEGALLHILACLRRATRATFALHRDGQWRRPDDRLESLFGRKVGLHGFGHIARELITLLQPFGVELAAFAPDLDAEKQAKFNVRAAVSLEALFSENDIVVELAPLNPRTRGIVTERHLRLLRRGAVFVNVGRGAVVDEAALCRVAIEGNILMGLDVFATEPIPANSPLRGLPNVFLTPHEAGAPQDRHRDCGAFALKNIRAYAAGQPLEAVITPEIFDLIT